MRQIYKRNVSQLLMVNENTYWRIAVSYAFWNLVLMVNFGFNGHWMENASRPQWEIYLMGNVLPFLMVRFMPMPYLLYRWRISMVYLDCECQGEMIITKWKANFYFPWLWLQPSMSPVSNALAQLLPASWVTQQSPLTSRDLGLKAPHLGLMNKK